MFDGIWESALFEALVTSLALLLGLLNTPVCFAFVLAFCFLNLANTRQTPD